MLVSLAEGLVVKRPVFGASFLTSSGSTLFLDPALPFDKVLLVLFVAPTLLEFVAVVLVVVDVVEEELPADLPVGIFEKFMG